MVAPPCNLFPWMVYILSFVRAVSCGTLRTASCTPSTAFARQLLLLHYTSLETSHSNSPATLEQCSTLVSPAAHVWQSSDDRTDVPGLDPVHGFLEVASKNLTHPCDCHTLMIGPYEGLHLVQPLRQLLSGMLTSRWVVNSDLMMHLGLHLRSTEAVPSASVSATVGTAAVTCAVHGILQ